MHSINPTPSVGSATLLLMLLCIIPTVSAAEAGRGAISVINVDGTGLGAIPDGPSTTCGTVGTSLDVIFAVPGFVGTVADVQIVLTFNPAHTWAGDISARLINPVGFTHVLFGRVGATTSVNCGFNANLSGPYLFSDSAASSPSGGFWQAADATANTAPIPIGTFRTTNSGGAGAVNPMPPTSLRSSFATTTGGVPGNWTLRLTDVGLGDTGTISSATLVLYIDETIFADGFDADFLIAE